MIIHNTQWLDSLHTSREAKRWHASDIISIDQYAAIKAKFLTPLYTPNLFIRMVLFFFTYIALSGVYGMAFMVVGLAGDRGISIFCLVVGIISFVVLEALIKQKNLYKAGIDDALLYASLGFSIGGLVWIYLDTGTGARDWVIPWILPLPFLLWGVVRFADRIVTIAAYVCILGAIFTAMFEAGPLAKAILPFVAMAVALVSYFLSRKGKDERALKPYEECLFVLEILALATFYWAGNYLGVRMGNELLMEGVIPEGQDMPFAWLFYVFTALTPIVYIVRGLMVRDHLLLRAGLITAVLSVLTFRHYFHVLPPDVALTLAGLALSLVAVAAIRNLKTRIDGFTDKHLLKEKLKGLNAEALVIAHTLGASPQVQAADKKLEGGGGEFGGGGTSGNW